ncbi:MAG: Fe2+-dependent dioxygenase [Gammaproteobacteria bacterium]
MLLEIPKVVDAEQLGIIRQLLARGRFVDGRQSAGITAGRVKRNRELEPQAPELKQLNQLVLGSLYRHPTFRSAALPYRLSGAYFAYYSEGMAYGDHVDDPVMGERERYRSDIAITIFLSDAAHYDGGELVIRTAFGDKAVKLAAGDAVIYPASSLHRVTEVTRGERWVAVAWSQSLVRDPARRELLYELDTVREALRRVMPEALVTAKVDHCYVNLVRLWAEV